MMNYPKSVISFVWRRRSLLGLTVFFGVLLGFLLWTMMPPAPRTVYKVKGQRLFYSPDGRYLAVVENVLHSWKPPPGVRLRGPPPMPDKSHIQILDTRNGLWLSPITWSGGVEVRSLVFSRNGKRIAALSVWTREIREWEIATGKVLQTFSRQQFDKDEIFPRLVAYPPQGEVLALSFKKDRSGVLWDCGQRRAVAALSAKDDGADEVSVPGILLAMSANDTLKAWRLDTGVLTATFPEQKGGFRYPPNITLSLDGKTFLRGTRDKVTVWTADGKKRVLHGVNAESRPRLSPDNQLLAAFAWRDLNKRRPNFLESTGVIQPPSDWSILTLYDMRDGAQLALFPGAKESLFSPAGDTLAVLCEDDTLQLWDVRPQRPWWKIAGFAALGGLGFFLLGSVIQKMPALYRAVNRRGIL